MGNSNTQRLGEILLNRMRQTANATVRPVNELGTVQRNLSIKVDSLKDPIPQGDYMVNLMLTGSRDTSYSGGHSHTLPNGFHTLRTGDRVLIAWCGHEPVVIAIVVSS